MNLFEIIGAFSIAVVLTGASISILSAFPSKEDLKDGWMYKGMALTIVGIAVLFIVGAAAIVIHTINNSDLL